MDMDCGPYTTEAEIRELKKKIDERQKELNVIHSVGAHAT